VEDRRRCARKGIQRLAGVRGAGTEEVNYRLSRNPFSGDTLTLAVC
jgi:hypothetical protein